LLLLEFTTVIGLSADSSRAVGALVGKTHETCTIA